MILDSGSEMVNEYTIQGYQEVEMPDGFEPTDEIEIEMSILYGMSVYCQDENNVYFSQLMTPENRGIFRLPFKVNLNGQTEAYTGSVTTGAYSAQATIRVSDVDISGEVVFDAPEWAAAMAIAVLAALMEISGTFSKAFSPSEVMYLSMENLPSEVQPLKAPAPIS